MNIRVIWRRDRYLRGSDHVSFQAQGYPAARITEPRENFNHEHRNVEVISGVEFGDRLEFVDFRLHGPGGQGQRRRLVGAGDQPGDAEERADPRNAPGRLRWHQRHGPHLGRQPGDRPVRVRGGDTGNHAPRTGPRRSPSAMSPRSPWTSRRTTCSSASARSTKPGTGARSASRSPSQPDRVRPVVRKFLPYHRSQVGRVTVKRAGLRARGSRPNMSGRPRNPLRTASCDSARSGPVAASTPARQRRMFHLVNPSQPPIMNTNQLGPDGGSAPPPAT